MTTSIAPCAPILFFPSYTPTPLSLEFFSDIDPCASHRMQMMQLKSRLTPSDQNVWQGIINYSSTAALSIRYFEGIAFTEIQIFEMDNLKLPLIDLSFQENNGELLNLRRGKSINGTSVKTLNALIVKYLKPNKITLFDVSTIQISYVGKKKMAKQISFQLFRFLPILSKDGNTWYGRDGYSPYRLVNKKFESIAQVYFSSVKKVRETLIHDIAFVLVSKKKSKLLKLCHHYFALNNATATVHQLGNVLYNNHKIDAGHLRDFKCFYKLLIPTEYDATTDVARSFKVALYTIGSVYYWKKNLLNPEKNMNYDFFLTRDRLIARL